MQMALDGVKRKSHSYLFPLIVKIIKSPVTNDLGAHWIRYARLSLRVDAKAFLYQPRRSTAMLQESNTSINKECMLMLQSLWVARGL